MQRQRLVIVVIALVALMAAPAVAAESGWTVRIHGVWDRPSVGLSGAESEVPIDAGSNGALGVGAGLEYRFGRWVGLEFDALHAGPEIVLEATVPGGRVRASDSLGFTPISVGPVFHVAPGARVDLTLTAVLGFARYGDLQFTAVGQTLRFEGGNTPIWGLGAAVDVSPSDSNWTIHARVRRYESSPKFTNRDNDVAGSAGMNPLVVGFGVGYRF